MVVAGAFGYFILGSVLSMGSQSTGEPRITNAHLQSLLIFEVIMYVVLILFLSLRNWRPSDIGLVPSLKDSLTGLGLALAGYLVYVVAWLIVSQFEPALQTRADTLVKSDLSLGMVVAVSIINPIYEEVFVSGYIITALKSRGMWLAINISVAVRLAYHLYQGAYSLINIIPLGLFFGYWYARTGRLWPLIVAHGLFDFLALAFFISH